MPNHSRVVIGGVDTHGRTHHAAVLDEQGRLLGDREFPADRGGYRQLLSWLGRHGQVGVVGVEGTGSYGAGLAGYLLDQQVSSAAGIVEIRTNQQGAATLARWGGSEQWLGRGA
jgi:transposase